MSILPFDDRDGSIWFDGRLIPWRDAKLHVLTHGLHYASCVFEGERVYNGHLFRGRDHTERLFNSARILGYQIPFTMDEIDRAKTEVVAANGFRDAYVRPIAWRGSEMMGVSAQQTKIHVAIATWDWPAYFAPEARMKGIRMVTGKWRRPDPATAPTAAKATGLYMICTMNKHDAEAAGYADALMLDYRGLISEATGANIFLVQDGVLHTPTPDCFLNGITRRTVIGLAEKHQMQVVERHIGPDELGRTQEVFLAGTAAEVTPIASIDQHQFSVGRITQTLMKDYDALVRQAPTGKAS
jgi:branched-chain amino acid aminotransferase